jgi:hypothetical protein
MPDHHISFHGNTEVGITLHLSVWPYSLGNCTLSVNVGVHGVSVVRTTSVGVHRVSVVKTTSVGVQFLG